MACEHTSAINTTFALQSVLKFPQAYRLGAFITILQPFPSQMLLTRQSTLRILIPSLYAFASDILNIRSVKYSNTSVITVVSCKTGGVLKKFHVTLYDNETWQGQSLGHHESDLGAVKDERRPAA